MRAPAGGLLLRAAPLKFLAEISHRGSEWWRSTRVRPMLVVERKEKTMGFLDDAKDKLNEAKDKAADTASDLKDKAADAASEAKDKVEEQK